MVNPTPDVSCRYGAPMGRGDSFPHNHTILPVKFRLMRVRLDNGGYDSGGAYWGIGQPLYYAETYWNEGEDDKELVTRYFRAIDRADAKQAVINEFPNARFYR